jgi:enterochelin esterase-like enzyme
MKILFVSIIFLVGCTSLKPNVSKNNIPISENQPFDNGTENMVTKTSNSQCEQFQIYSGFLELDLTIKISLPKNYFATTEQNINSIYLLDAAYFFDESEGTLDYILERGAGMANNVHSLIEDEKIPPSVLIGMSYSEEIRMTLTVEKVDAFYKFLAEELIPQIEEKCQVIKTASSRTLFGYSASAHLSTYILMNDVAQQQNTFNNFISIAGVYRSDLPADQLTKELLAQDGAIDFGGRKVFMAIGEKDGPHMFRDYRDFVAILDSAEIENLEFISKEYAGLGHYNIPEFGFFMGLTWVFSNP